MAKNYLDTFVLPNSSTYYFRDNEAIGSITRTGDSLIVANRVGTQTIIPNTDFDTINVTELNAGNLIVTGAARFLNTINGNITGQAGSVANSLTIQLNSGTTEGTNKFTYNGSSAKTVNITKSGIGLSNVENKSSATIRGEITSSNVTTALGYTPLNKAGDTMTGPLKFGDQAIPQFSGSPSYILGIEAFASGGDVKWQNVSSIKVGSATKDGNGNVIADYYVKKSGDTMSGLLTTQAGITTNASLVLQKPDDVEWSLNGNNGEPAVEMVGDSDKTFKFKFTQYGTNVDVGWDWAAVDGSGAFFRQANSPSSPGCFGFFARSSVGTAQLIGNPNGTLTWNNRRVVTSTNGSAIGSATQPVYVNSSGYVTAGTALSDGAYRSISTTVTQNDTNLITSGAVYQAIADLPEPMVFKGTLGTNGTITDLPTASSENEGFTYKVITAGTYASQSAKVGDLFVCAETSSGVYSWVIIPAGDTDSDTWRNIKVDGTEKLSTAISSGLIDFTSGNHISLSFNATGNKLTVAHADTSSQASVSNSGRTYIQSITLDGDGHVTKLTSATETVTDTNYYHKTGTWSGLTYTAAKVGSPDDLAFTIPTGTTATTVALGNHNHDGVYLKLSGGTMTGVLALKGSQYEDSYSGALNANNSNIYNLNSIYTADASNSASEGIHFYRDTTHVDTLWVYNGNLLFVPNRELGVSTTTADSQKVGRFTANPTSGQVVITDGTTGGMISSGYTIATSVPANAKFTDTTYTIGTSGNSVTLTPSSGSAQSITVPYATSAGSATNDSNGYKIVDTYLPLKTNAGIKNCSGGGSYRWFKIATLTITGGYANGPVTFEVSQRQYAFTTLQVCFANNSSADPELSYFITNYDNHYYIKRIDTSVWELYGQYSEAWGSCSLHRISGFRYNNGVSVTVEMSNLSEEPEGKTQVIYGGYVYYATTAGSATKATQDESGNNIKATYASSFSISDHTITLKNKNGDSIGTVTVPDNNTTYGLSASNDNITLTAGGTGTTVQAHLCYNIAIRNTTDWNTFQNAGAYKVQMSSWGDADTYHSPNSYKSNLYSFGMLYVVKSGVSAENRIFQYYIPHSTSYPILVRSHNSSSWDNGWSTWYPIYNGMTLAKENIGSASAGTAISADDITAWDAGSTPTLGTAISADDITSWSAGTMFSASFDGKCTLTLTSGSVPTLSYTGRSIPNVTSVGSVPTLSYTARLIPNISVTSKSVVTGIS